MAHTSTLSVDVDSDTMALVDRVAQRRGMSSRQFAAEAVRRAAESDDDFDAFLQVGMDDIERGNVVPHEQVMADLGVMIEAHRARCG